MNEKEYFRQKWTKEEIELLKMSYNNNEEKIVHPIRKLLGGDI